jgi:MGT family glycosyltransferase
MQAAHKMHFAFACVEQMGHFMPLVPFVQELLERGHHVTLFIADSSKYKDKIQEFEIVAEVVPVVFPCGGLAAIKKAGVRRVLSKGGPLAVLSEPLFEAITGHYKVTDILPSVIITDFFATAAKDAGDALGVPVVDVYPNPMGLGPGLLNPKQRGVSQKFREFSHIVKEALGARLALALRNRERRLRNLSPMLEQDVWPCHTMKRPTIDMWGLGYEYAFIQSPLLTFVGPSEPPCFPPIAGDLETWFAEQTRPIVYVAFGTMHEFTESSCKNLLEQLECLTDAAVLWSLPTDQQKNLDGMTIAVRLESFVPQYAVLKHPKVATFVTHCGSNSVSEAILAEVPLVCCPMKADQPSNAARIQSAGIGIVAHGGVRGVGSAVRAMLDDLGTHSKHIQKVKGMLLSNGGARRGADVIEVVAKFGYGHLVPLSHRFPVMRAIGGFLSLVGILSVLKRRL